MNLELVKYTSLLYVSVTRSRGKYKLFIILYLQQMFVFFELETNCFLSFGPTKTLCTIIIIITLLENLTYEFMLFYSF